MKTSTIFFTLTIGFALALTGCKTDEEPDWDKLAQTDQTQPSTTPGQTDEPSSPQGTAGIRDIRLNELNGNGDKYIELYNLASEAVDISGMQLRKDAEKIVYVAPEGTRIAAKSILTLMANQADFSTGFNSGLSAKKSVIIELLTPDGNEVVDVFKNPSQSAGEVWGATDPKLLLSGKTFGDDRN